MTIVNALVINFNYFMEIVQSYDCFYICNSWHIIPQWLKILGNKSIIYQIDNICQP